jgi:predicted RNA polymerase sigma factor
MSQTAQELNLAGSKHGRFYGRLRRDGHQGRTARVDLHLQEARAAYRRALDLATSTPERRFLARRLEQV